MFKYFIRFLSHYLIAYNKIIIFLDKIAFN